MRGQEREEVELAVGQRDRLAGDADLATGQVDLDALADLDHRAGAGGRPPRPGAGWPCTLATTSRGENGLVT